MKDKLFCDYDKNILQRSLLSYYHSDFSGVGVFVYKSLKVKSIGVNYINSNPQGVSLYHNSLLWLDTPDSWSWDQNPFDSYASRRFYHTATRKLV